jgi:uncharacterized protein (TIGR00725 family)
VKLRKKAIQRSSSDIAVFYQRRARSGRRQQTRSRHDRVTHACEIGRYARRGEEVGVPEPSETKQVSVIGSGAEHTGRAEKVGRLLAERGCVVVTGGLGEVMAAAARGAKSAGGTTIGVLPGESRADANEWIDHAVVTGIGHARNLAVVASGDAVIAVGGSWGTLAEIGFARRLGRPVVVLEPGWEVGAEGIERAATAAEAVDLALRLMG